MFCLLEGRLGEKAEIFAHREDPSVHYQIFIISTDVRDFFTNLAPFSRSCL